MALYLPRIARQGEFAGVFETIEQDAAVRTHPICNSLLDDSLSEIGLCSGSRVIDLATWQRTRCVVF
jgi:hypothetical protein